jgi:regulator of chromosome condensation
VKKKIKEKKYQRRPALIPQLKKIKLLAAGANHVQALDHKGNVFCWGTGEQSQLGRRIVERNRAQALTPCQFGLPRNKIGHVSCGAYHSFAIDVKGRVYAWGLNNFGQTGIVTGAGENEATIGTSSIVRNLEGYKIKEIKGGNHHSIACTEDGKVLVWGRCDDAQAGIPLQDLPQTDLVFDSRNKPRILIKPTVIPGNLSTP